MKLYYNIQDQLKRNKENLLKVAKYNIQFFGTAEYLERLPKVRMFERLNKNFAYYSSGIPQAIEEANRLFREENMSFCQFFPLLSLEMLYKFKDVMAHDVYEKLESYVKDCYEQYLESDLDFVGVNDNFPCIATYIAVIAGERYCNKKAVEVGRKRLKQLSEMLYRRGSQSEYNSPSYASGQLMALSCLAERTKDYEIRELALLCEERILFDVLSHSMPEICTSTGPSSRRYKSGYMGGVGTPNIIYQIYGEDISVSVKHQNFSDLYICPIHCPIEIAEWFKNRKFPCIVESTFEVNSSTDALPNGNRRGHHYGFNPDTRDPNAEDILYEYPSLNASIYTYLQGEYSLGTATGEYHSGSQTDSFLISYKKLKNVTEQTQTGWVLSKYIINDKLPFQANEYPQIHVKDGGFLPMDMGRKTAVQHENSAMVLYKPKAFASKGVYSMRLCIVFPAIVHSPIEEIYLGENKVENFNGASKELCSIYVKDNDTYMAFHPMVPVQYGVENSVTVEYTNEAVIVSLYNYKGENRDFATHGFVLTGNGFACEVRQANEYANFDDFRKKMSNFVIEDVYETNANARQTYQRISKYETEKTCLECEYSPVSEGIRYQTANGETVGQKKLSVTDFDVSTLPFMKKSNLV